MDGAEHRLGAVLAAVHEAKSGAQWRPEGLLGVLRRVFDCERVFVLAPGDDGELQVQAQVPDFDIATAARAQSGAARTWFTSLWTDFGRCADRYGVAAMPELRARRSASGTRTDPFAMAVSLAEGSSQRGLMVLCRSTVDFSAKDRFEIGLLRPHLDAVYRTKLRRRGAAVLTARQRDILSLVAAGRTNAEIAAALVLSVGTVRKHLDNIYARLGVCDRGAAVLRAAVRDAAHPF